MFGVSIAVAQTVFVGLFEGLDAGVVVVIISVFYLAAILAALVRFTHHPPQEPDIFLDPITKRYGLKGHAAYVKDAGEGPAEHGAP